MITASAATSPHAWPPIAKRSGSLAAEICTRIVEQAFWELDAPIGRVCSEEVPIPYPRHLENAAIPQAPIIVAAAKAALARS